MKRLLSKPSKKVVIDSRLFLIYIVVDYFSFTFFLTKESKEQM